MWDSNTRWIKKKPVIAMLAVLCALLWGSAYPCIKISYKLFGIQNGNPYDKIYFAGIRFILAGLAVILVMSLFNQKVLLPKPRIFWKIIVLGIVQTGIQYAFFYIGLSNTAGSKSAIISGSATLLAICFSAMVNKADRFTLRKLTGCLIGFLGVIIINVNEELGGFKLSFKGEGFLLLASIFFAMGSVICRWAAQEEKASTVAGYQLVIGGVFLTVIGLLMGGHISIISAKGIAMFLYMVILSALAYALWTLLLSANQVASVSIYYSFVPVFGVLLSGLLLQEKVLNWNSIAALVMVCLAIYIVNSNSKSVTWKHGSKKKEE